jgi:long-chain acyl-CoA synthetase
VTYRELDERSNQGAQLLRSLGLRPGDAIAILLENHPRFFEICWAAQRSGLYYTPISYRLTAPEVDIVRDCGAGFILSATRDVAAALAPAFADLAGAISSAESRFEATRRDRAAPAGRCRQRRARTCSTPRARRGGRSELPLPAAAGTPPALAMLLKGLPA